MTVFGLTMKQWALVFGVMGEQFSTISEAASTKRRFLLRGMPIPEENPVIFTGTDHDARKVDWDSAVELFASPQLDC